MRKIRLSRFACSFALCLGAGLALPAGAAEADWQPAALRISGFGTLGYTADDRANIVATRDISQLPKNEESTGANWRTDSRLGVQLEYKINPRADLVAQFVARDHFKPGLATATELAYLALHPAGEFDVRLGRFSYDAFLMSDHRNVGYAYPWVRPPLEFYAWIPIFSVDGLDATYKLQSSDAVWRFKAQAGTNEFWIPVNSGKGGGYHFKADQLSSVSVTRQASNWRLKAAHSRFTSAREIPAFAALHQGLAQVAAAGLPGVSAEAASLRQQLAFKDARIAYTTLGVDYDDNTWVVQAELGHSTATVDVVPTNHMAYVSVARRFGAWMPFVMASVSRPTSELHQARNDWGSSLNAQLRNPALQTVDALRINQHALSLGLRWDFHPQAAFKLQLDHAKSKPPGDGVWFRAPGLRMETSTLNLLTATVDFVF